MTATKDGCASSTQGHSRQPPFIFADASHWQGDNPPWKLLEPLTGIILKATQSLDYAPDWFVRHWNTVACVGGARYSESWFRGAYHFLDFNHDGKKQADYYLAHVERAGGWKAGDICPIVDVELGGGNEHATAKQVVDCTSAFSARIKERLGRDTILYGRGAMRDLGIKSRMGCAAVWNPAYTPTMVVSGLLPTWTLDDVVLWQYTDGKSGDNRHHGCPIRIEGWPGGLDLSVFVDGAKKPTMERLKARLLRT